LLAKPATTAKQSGCIERIEESGLVELRAGLRWRGGLAVEAGRSIGLCLVALRNCHEPSGSKLYGRSAAEAD
jgi:hypothetical protein